MDNYQHKLIEVLERIAGALEQANEPKPLLGGQAKTPNPHAVKILEGLPDGIQPMSEEDIV